MSKNLIRKLAFIAVIFMLALGSVWALPAAKGSGTGYNIPRMLGSEGNGGETFQLDGPRTTDISGPIVETFAAAASMDLDLRDLPQVGPETKRPMRELGRFPAPVNENAEPDPVIQTNETVGDRPLSEPLAPAPAPLMNFKGLDFSAWGSGWPPDTHGDVGPNHYIQVVNTSIGVYSKTGTQLAAFTFDSLFSGTGTPCDASNQGDTVALYDQVSGRWIITDFAWGASSGPFYECIAVSKTADPVSGGWWFYALVADSTRINDYPKLGIWSDGIYMSANLFTATSYAGAKVWALNRADMTSGAALRSVAFTLGTAYYSLLPANLRGDLPPSGTPAYFMADGYTIPSSMDLWKFTVNWATPASSTFSGPTNFSVASFSEPPFTSVPQLGGDTLDTLGDRLMTWLQYRNVGGTESLWVSRTVAVSSYTGIRWMEVRNMSATPSVYQQGTYAPDTKFRWMPSLAVDKMGNMAVGYSVSSSTMYPAIRYAGRLVTDPLNTLGQTETSLIEGTGSQSGGYGRWGDYSSMSVDPSDDCTFWYTTEYYEPYLGDPTNYHWQTRIGSFRFPNCGGTPTDNPPTVALTNPANGATVAGTVNVTATATDDNGVAQVEFFVDGGSIGVDSNCADGWSASWNTTTYSEGAHTVSATATDTIAQTASASRNVTVQNNAPNIHVGDLDASILNYFGLYWKPTVTITIHNNAHTIMPRVIVDFTWSGGVTRTGRCLTNTKGQCAATPGLLRNSSVTTVTLNITKLTLYRSTISYNPAANHDPDGDSNGTTIVIVH